MYKYSIFLSCIQEQECKCFSYRTPGIPAFPGIFRLPNVIRVPRGKASVLSAKDSIDPNTFSYSALRLLDANTLCSPILDKSVPPFSVNLYYC